MTVFCMPIWAPFPAVAPVHDMPCCSYRTPPLLRIYTSWWHLDAVFPATGVTTLGCIDTKAVTPQITVNLLRLLSSGTASTAMSKCCHMLPSHVGCNTWTCRQGQFIDASWCLSASVPLSFRMLCGRAALPSHMHCLASCL